jgi:3-phenylpropionate/trans-cinnamate dioxygenase ferredoxin reductase subunit
VTTSPGVVVVGASAAGLSTAEGLRRSGYDGPLTLVGDEPHLPYDRPPLSKQLLAGQWPAERLWLRSPQDYTDLDLRLRLGVPARSLRTSAHLLHLADGSRLAYDTLVVATGARARTPDGSAAGAGTHVLRTLEDALALRDELTGHPRLVIVGGGFVGAEAAAVARALDCEVTLVTSGDAPLTDALGDTVAQVLAEVHREHGVRLVTGSRAVEVLRERGRTVGVRLATGRVVPADAVLAGVGARPNTEWLAGSGVPVGDGVDCDVCLYAGDDVWAAGDVASWPDPGSGCVSNTAPTPPSRATPSPGTSSPAGPRRPPSAPCPTSGPTSTASGYRCTGVRAAPLPSTSSTAARGSGGSPPCTSATGMSSVPWASACSARCAPCGTWWPPTRPGLRRTWERPSSTGGDDDAAEVTRRPDAL